MFEKKNSAFKNKYRKTTFRFRLFAGRQGVHIIIFYVIWFETKNHEFAYYI